MGIIQQKLYINGVWDEVVTLGRFLPLLTTSAVYTIVVKQHLTAAIVFKTVCYFTAVRNTVGFFCQMAVRYISELVVCFQRLQVGKPLGSLNFEVANIGMFIRQTDTMYLQDNTFVLCS